MKWTLLALLAVLAGCSAAQTPGRGLPVPTSVPQTLATCPEGVPPPVPPPVPRTVQQLADYANAAEAARARTEHARSVCATRLQLLNAWIRQHR